jgi:signal transduction histidine kinase
MLSDDAVEEGIGYFVCVPLKSKDRTLGIMNVAYSIEHYFTENDFKLLDSIGFHVGLAIENSVLYEEAKQKEQLRGQLLSSVITAQEEERKRIARELHDEYGQSLTALKMSIESSENMTSPGQRKLKEKLRSAEALVVNTLEDLRRLTLDLRPYALDELGLIAAIRAYAQRHLESAGIKVKFENKDLNERLAPAVETTLFRIIQETIHNTTKHAQAKNVKIQLAARNDKITVVVEDDGMGFNVDATFKSKVGMQSLGLLGIQERATLLGGTFKIESQPGRGTCLIVEIPVVGSLGEPSQSNTGRNRAGLAETQPGL